jgi:hypothetical protein
VSRSDPAHHPDSTADHLGSPSRATTRTCRICVGSRWGGAALSYQEPTPLYGHNVAVRRRQTEALSPRQSAALRILAYTGIAVVGIVTAWILMPYPENACPDEYGATCTTPSARQRHWLALILSIFVLAVLAADVLRVRSQGVAWIGFIVPAVVGALVVLAGFLFLFLLAI